LRVFFVLIALKTYWIRKTSVNFKKDKIYRTLMRKLDIIVAINTLIVYKFCANTIKSRV